MLALAIGVLLALALPHPGKALAQGGTNGTITHTTGTDFAAGCAILTDTEATSYGDGEIRLIPLLADHFEGSQLNTTMWLSDSVNSGIGIFPVVGSSIVTLENSWIRSQEAFSPSRIALTAKVQFGSPGTGWADLGFGKPGQVSGYPNILFITDGSGNLYANSNHPDNGGEPTRHLITGVNVADFHIFRLVVDDWQTIDYYVDGLQRRTHAFATPVFTQPAYIWFMTIFQNNEIYADWIRLDYYEKPAGSYVSCVQDAGQVVNWSNLTWEAEVPISTTLAFRTRTSNDGVAWSAWSAPLYNSGDSIANPSGRYFQYMAELSTADAAASPELQQVIINYFGPTSLVVTPTTTALPVAGTQQFKAQVYDQNGDPITGLPYTWQVINGGGTIDGNGLFTAGSAWGTYSDTVRARSAGLSGFATVIVANLPPTADAGGPYSGSEGGQLTLNGSGND
ncbi:MAG: hypothetical protein ACE5EY_14760, partial [Anaerolineae bacterium]